MSGFFVKIADKVGVVVADLYLLKRRVLGRQKLEADLISTAANAAMQYVKERGEGLNLLDQQNMINQVAHGFYMGYRAAESNLGARSNEVDPGRLGR